MQIFTFESNKYIIYVRVKKERDKNTCNFSYNILIGTIAKFAHISYSTTYILLIAFRSNLSLIFFYLINKLRKVHARLTFFTYLHMRV